MAGNANTAKKLQNLSEQLKRAGTPWYLEQYDSAFVSVSVKVPEWNILAVPANMVRNRFP